MFRALFVDGPYFGHTRIFDQQHQDYVIAYPVPLSEMADGEDPWVTYYLDWRDVDGHWVGFASLNEKLRLPFEMFRAALEKQLKEYDLQFAVREETLRLAC